MSRTNWILLGLVTLLAVIGLYMSGDPDQAARISEMRRNAAFTGQARDMVLLVLAFGLGGFIIYLTMTRR